MTPRRWLLLALALGALLRFFGLGREGLWVDEAYTSGLIHGSAAEIWARLRVDDAPPLFYLLSKGFVALAGPGEFALRLLPALASIGVIAVVGLLLERQSTRTLLVGLGLAATSALLIYYGRQARSYSLLQFEASLLLLFTLRAGERLDARRAIVVALLGLSALYTHNLGLWPFTAAVLALLPKLRGAERKPLLLLLLLGALGAIPWAVRLAEQVGIHRDLNQWMAKYWETRPYALAPLMSLGVFVNGGTTVFAPPIFLGGWGGAGIWLVGLLWGACGVALVLAARLAFAPALAPAGAGARPVARIALLFTLVPIGGLLLSSLVSGPAYVLGRTETAALPAFLILLALGFGQMRRPLLVLMALLLWATLGGVALWPSWTASGERSKGSDRAVAAALGARLGPRDAVVFSSLVRPSLESYARLQGWRERVQWFGGFPAIVDQNPAAVYPTPPESLAVWQAAALELRREWEAAGVEQVWIFGVREARALPLRTPWARRPAPPAVDRREIGAAQITYPTNLVLATLVGLRSVSAELEYQQDWVSGERLLLRIPRSAWVSVDSLPAIEVAR
ncbi:MAG: glycosyltransferase family 39 protein [Candidatus Eisenbacteria bacterium]|nr:glycosyltransferase family 39 protein [Candidatus Eisenbacteria bacterium]